MKKKLLLVMAGVALFVFIFATSILWYNFFYNDTSSNAFVSSLRIEMDDDHNILNEDNLIPLDEETAKNLKSYDFTVNNTSNVSTTYNVIIEDSVISDDENFTNKSLLSRNQLEYQLALNGKVIKKGLLSDIKNNLLDTRNIEENKSNNYQLRIYVSEKAQNTDWQNKYYHFNIKIQTEVN